MQRRGSSSGTAAAALALVGGAVAALGSLLGWAKASVGASSFSAKGIDGWEGKVTIVAGVVMLIAGGSALVGAEGARARLRVSALVGGIAAAGVGVYTALTATDQVVDSAASQIAAEIGIPVQQARTTIEAALDHGLLHLSLQIGLYLVIAGGALGIVAGIVVLLSGAPVPTMPAQVAAGSGLTGWAAPLSAVPAVPTPATEEGPATPPRTTPLPPKPGEVPLTASVWALPQEGPTTEQDGASPDRGEDDGPSELS